MENYKKEIKRPYLEGYSTTEIGSLLGKSGRTISYHLNKMGIKIRKSKKIDQQMFEKLWEEGKTDSEIADFFKVKETTVKTFRTKGENSGKFKITRHFSQEEHHLSEIQKQFIYGSLLGDLNIQFSKNCKNARLMLVHCEAQQDLFDKKREILGEFMGSYRLYIPKPDPRTGKIYKSWRGQSKAHKEFNTIYKKFYPNGKVLTKENLELINHPIALAFWFMDDGTKRGTIATNCFSEKEVDLLIDWMKNKWNILCTKQKNLKNFVLHISAKSRLNFEKLIFPYVVPSIYYKLEYITTLVGLKPCELRETPIEPQLLNNNSNIIADELTTHVQ